MFSIGTSCVPKSHFVEPHSYWAVPFFFTYRTRPPTFCYRLWQSWRKSESSSKHAHTHTWQIFYSHARMQIKAFTVLLFMTWYVNVHVAFPSCLAFPSFAFENLHTTYHDTRLKHEQSPLYLQYNNHLLNGPWMTARMTSLMNLLSGNINYKQVHMQ